VEVIKFFITALGDDDIILGHAWLRKHNPQIDWRASHITFTACPTICRSPLFQQWAWHWGRTPRAACRHQSKIQKTTLATELAAARNPMALSSIPIEYQQHQTIFNEAESRSLPPRSIWDHSIDLVPDAPTSSNCKIYPLNPAEQITLDSFLKDMQERGYSISTLQSLPSPPPSFSSRRRTGSYVPFKTTDDSTPLP